MRWWLLGAIVGTVLYCEFIGDYVALLKCSWPEIKISESESKLTINENEILRVMLISDTHLLGPVRGNFLDKLYREWHMRGAFKAAIKLHQPEVVFVLGDLFDEGDIVDSSQFENYVQRFRRHFHTPNGIPVISVVGNHDVGFHYRMRPFLVERFETEFHNTGAKLYTFKDIHFVLINSMSLYGDGCNFCEKTSEDLRVIATQFECLKHTNTCTDTDTLRQHRRYSRPIVLQHIPTYRVSDKACIESDAPEIEKYRADWEVLSKESTDLLGNLLRPRLAFAGHSHHYCFNINRWGQREYTIASFSWRNKVDPSFLMASLSRTTSEVSKCYMLAQGSVIFAYKLLTLLLVSILIYKFYKKFLCTNLRKVYIKMHSTKQKV